MNCALLSTNPSWWGNPPLFFANLGMEHLTFLSCPVAGVTGLVAFFVSTFAVLCVAVGIAEHINR